MHIENGKEDSDAEHVASFKNFGELGAVRRADKFNIFDQTVRGGEQNIILGCDCAGGVTEESHESQPDGDDEDGKVKACV